MDVDTLAHQIDICQYSFMSMREDRPRCCAPLLRKRLEREDAEQLASAFKAIADPGRLRLLSYIAAQPGAEACVCHLVEPLGLAQPTVSHHLRVLTEAGLLTRERRATWMFYRLVPERVEALREALSLPPAHGGAAQPSA
jgi:ArsR family transcriptional regulator